MIFLKNNGRLRFEDMFRSILLVFLSDLIIARRVVDLALTLDRGGPLVFANVDLITCSFQCMIHIDDFGEARIHSCHFISIRRLLSNFLLFNQWRLFICILIILITNIMASIERAYTVPLVRSTIAFVGFIEHELQVLSLLRSEACVHIPARCISAQIMLRRPNTARVATESLHNIRR